MASPGDVFPSTRTNTSMGSEIQTNLREYLSVEQLSALTPWSPQSIRSMMSRGKFREGEHFYRPFGPGSHAIFKWTAVKQLIEDTNACATDKGTIFLANGAAVNVDGDGEAEDTSRVHG